MKSRFFGIVKFFISPDKFDFLIFSIEKYAKVTKTKKPDKSAKTDYQAWCLDAFFPKKFNGKDCVGRL
jgi:hypothetical protein